MTSVAVYFCGSSVVRAFRRCWTKFKRIIHVLLQIYLGILCYHSLLSFIESVITSGLCPNHLENVNRTEIEDENVERYKSCITL